MPQIQVLVLSGEVSNDDVASVIEFAGSLGFAVSQHTVVSTEREDPSLAEILKPDEFQAQSLIDRGWIHVTDLNNEPLGELLDIVWVYAPPGGILRLFKIMAERSLAFSDADIAALRRHDLSELGLDVKRESLLERSHITSLEMLRHCTREQLLDLRNFGQSALDEVKEKLAARGLSLRDKN